MKEIEQEVQMIVDVATLPNALYKKYRYSGRTLEDVWNEIKGKISKN